MTLMLQQSSGCSRTADVSGPRFFRELSNVHKHDDLVFVVHAYNLHYAMKPAEGNPSEFSMDMDLENTLLIALDDGLPIIETLEVIKSSVTQTLDAFKPEFE